MYKTLVCTVCRDMQLAYSWNCGARFCYSTKQHKLSKCMMPSPICTFSNTQCHNNNRCTQQMVTAPIMCCSTWHDVLLVTAQSPAGHSTPHQQNASAIQQLYRYSTRPGPTTANRSATDQHKDLSLQHTHATATLPTLSHSFTRTHITHRPTQDHHTSHTGTFSQCPAAGPS
jgi:hypothetical protein